MAPISSCALCRQTGELRDSHLVPKALYRLARAGYSRGNPNPVALGAAGLIQTSSQTRKPLLCGSCEAAFDRNGENWVMRHCYRGRDRFRLRELLNQAVPIHSDNKNVIYDASTVPGLNIEKIAYFSMSIFWRAGVCDWESSGRRYRAISLGAKYQEQIRTYLLGKASFPENATLLFLVSALPRPAIMFNLPDTGRMESNHLHTLHIPGLTFQLCLGKQQPEGAADYCIVRSKFHPIFVCMDGDTRAQGGVMRLMGKTAPAGTSYPTINGVV